MAECAQLPESDVQEAENGALEAAPGVDYCVEAASRLSQETVTHHVSRQPLVDVNFQYRAAVRVSLGISRQGVFGYLLWEA